MDSFLEFDGDSQPSGEVLKAYRKHWHYTEPDGGYRSKRGFLWLELEVTMEKPHEVRVQVESPTYDVDPELNGSKLELMEILLRLAPEFQRAVAPTVTLRRGGQASVGSARIHCSTTVWVLVFPSDPTASARELGKRLLLKVHESIGDILERVWNSRVLL